MPGPLVGGAMTVSDEIDTRALKVIGEAFTSVVAITTIATRSFTPEADSVLLAVTGGDQGGSLRPGRITDSLGSVWTQIGTDFLGPNNSNFCAATAYSLAIGGSPAEMVVTCSFSAANSGWLTVIEFLDVSGAITNVGTFAGSASTAAAVLPSSPAATSTIVAGVVNASAAATGTTGPTGHTELRRYISGGFLQSSSLITYVTANGGQTATFTGMVAAGNNITFTIEVPKV
jgi:hypothetical protein